MDAAQKREIVRRKLDVAKAEYEELMAVEALAMGSVGLTVRYEGMGGRSSRPSDHTANQAIAALRVSETYRDKMRWLDVILDVYGKLMDRHDGPFRMKPLVRGLHDRSVARVLYGKVFKGWTLERIGDSFEKEGGKKSRQSVAGLYRDAVELIVALAEERGLLEP